MADYWFVEGDTGRWNFQLGRTLNGWEIDPIANLLGLLYHHWENIPREDSRGGDLFAGQFS